MSYLTPPFLVGEIDAFSRRAGRIRQDLYFCDVGPADMPTRELRIGIRAGTYLYLSAALEACVRDSLAGLLAEINLRAVAVNQVRLPLLALTHAPLLDGLSSSRGLKMWERRSAMLKSIGTSRACTFNPAILPLDGRTIRPEQMTIIWDIFGFDGSPLPSPRHRLALVDLAGARNDLAHGNAESRDVAGRKPIADLLRLVDSVEDCAVNLFTAIETYLTGDGYLR